MPRHSGLVNASRFAADEVDNDIGRLPHGDRLLGENDGMV
jgi:hypothetical protein